MAAPLPHVGTLDGGWREESTSFLRVLTFHAVPVERATVNDSRTRHSQLGNRLGSMHGAILTTDLSRRHRAHSSAFSFATLTALSHSAWYHEGFIETKYEVNDDDLPEIFEEYLRE
jgi:hypothetical protein